MLTAAERASFQKTLQQLLEKRRTATDELARETQANLHTQSDGSLPDPVEKQADPNAEAEEQEIDLALLENATVEVHEIEAALARVADGTYGMCSVCETPIAKERLKALPATRYCIRCARNLA